MVCVAADRMEIKDGAIRAPWVTRHEGREMDLQQHIINRNRLSREELIQYAGRYVAWSPDGTRILASGEDLEKVAAAVEEQGGDPAEVVLSFVPGPDEVQLGGAMLAGGHDE
jgi:hypothetical protein